MMYVPHVFMDAILTAECAVTVWVRAAETLPMMYVPDVFRDAIFTTECAVAVWVRAVETLPRGTVPNFVKMLVRRAVPPVFIYPGKGF